MSESEPGAAAMRLLARLTRVVALALVLAALGFCGWWRLSGGTWERVETSSMGTTAPVGTLIWVEPMHGHAVRRGEIVTFQPPDREGMVFTHRVLTVHADGTFATGGDLSGPDTWQVPEQNVVGRARWIWPGAGWLVLALPVLLGGAILTWGACLLLRRGQLSMLLVGASLTASVALVVYQPLSRADQLKSVAVGRGMRGTFVDTGVLPIRLSAPGSRPIELAAGEAGSILTSRPTAGRLLVDLAPVVPPWIWLLIIVSTFAPALLSLLGNRSVIDSETAASPVESQAGG